MAQLPPGFVLDQQPQQDPVIAVDPYKQAAEQRAREDQVRQAEAAARENAKFQYQIQRDQKADEIRSQEEADKAAKAQRANESAIGSLANVIEKIDTIAFDAADNGGLFETGRSGAFVRSLPNFIQAGTAAYDLAGNLKTVDANAAFNALNEMRQNSPTGGALGQVTEKELDLLKSSVGNLDPNQSQEQFFANLAGVKRTYLDMLRRLDPAKADELAKRPGIQFREDGQPVLVSPGGDPNAPPVDPMGLGGPPSGGGGPSSKSVWFKGVPGLEGDYSPSSLGRGFMQGVGSMVEAVGDTAGIVVNPINTVLGRAAGYDNYTSDFGTTLREALQLPDNQSPTGDAVIKGATAGLGMAGLARGGAALGSRFTNELARFASTPGRDAVAGGAAGLGGQVGQDIGGVPGQVAGTLVGGMAGYGGANALMRAAGPRAPNPTMQAADELGVKMLPADVGGVGTRMASGAVGRTLGGIPLAEGAQDAVASAGAARTNIARRVGEVTDNAGAGQAAKSGFKSFVASSGKRATELYEKVSVPAKADVELANTRGALEEVTRGFQSNPNLSRLWANHPKLRATLEALTPTDTRPAGQVRYAQETDKVRYAESSLYEARNRAISLRNEQLAAREELGVAQKAFDSLDFATTPASELSKARTRLANATARWNNVKDAKPDEAAIAAAEKALKPAKAAQDEAFIESRQPPMGGKLSWEDMKRFRTIVGEIVGQPGIARDGSDIAALRKLYAAITTDMEVTAANAGPRALQEFRRATQYWRGRESRIDNVFAALLGKDGLKSDEAVFRQINNWAKAETGDFKSVARMIRSMPQDEADTIRATIVNRMGMTKPARQDATGEVFSPAEFATQWRGMSDRAKNVLFPNKQHRQDLEKFASLMDGMKRANEYQNFSNTALGANLTGVGLTSAAGGIPGLIAAAAYSGVTFSLGKLLASPRFARLLASSAKAPSDVALKTFQEKLATIAANDNAVAADAKALGDFLATGAGRSPGAVAAGENEADARREPPQ